MKLDLEALKTLVLGKARIVTISSGSDVFRVVKKAYPDYLATPGKASGRCNVKGQEPKIFYSSLSKETALAEHQYYFSDASTTLVHYAPQLIVCRIKKNIQALALQSASDFERLNLSLFQYLDEWESQTASGQLSCGQALSLLLHEINNSREEPFSDAILVPSARNPGGFNLNILEQSIVAGKLELVEAKPL